MIADNGAAMIRAAEREVAGGLRVLGLVSQGEFQILCLAKGASYDP
jgi:hypothetical protein